MPRNDAETLVEQVKKHAKKPAAKKSSKIDRNELVPSGSTLLDLACSNSIYGAFKIGTMVNIIGDKSSGKTMLALSMLAECARLDRFDGFDFIFDDVEAANAFDVGGMFGKKLADRIQEPLKHGKSDTIKELEANLIKSIQKGKPFLYILDSFDALTTDEEIERAYARANDTKEKGSMGMQKAKGGHELFRILCRELQTSKGLFAIISQVKEDIDPMSMRKYKRTGGKALDFYAFHHIWLSMIGTIRAKERVIGHNVLDKVDKNKLNGNERVIAYDTYNSYGIDDVGSMVDFMIAEKYWTSAGGRKDDEDEDDGPKQRGKIKKIKKRKVVVVPDFDFTGTRDQIIHMVDENKLERKLKVMVADAWMEIEESLKLDRRPKYS